MRKIGRNRRIPKHAIVTLSTTGMAVLVVTGFFILMSYLWLETRCSTIMRDIGRAEKRLAALEAEREREQARWNEMKVPQRLEEKLIRFGLEMKYPTANQVVRMTANGRPREGQLSVARARNRAGLGDVAQASAVTRMNALPKAPLRHRR